MILSNFWDEKINATDFSKKKKKKKKKKEQFINIFHMQTI